MIHPLRFEPQALAEKPIAQTAPNSGNVFAGLLDDAAQTTVPAATGFQPGQWPNDPWGDPSQYSTQPAQGAGMSALDMSLYGRDAVNVQAEQNQIGNQFAAMTGTNPINFTAQLPQTPSLANQTEYDQFLAYQNLQRLKAGQPLEATDYWSEPPAYTDPAGKVYTSQDLGWTGAATQPMTSTPTTTPITAPAPPVAPAPQQEPATINRDMNIG